MKDYAEALARVGQTNLARDVLRAALRAPATFATRGDAERLLASLQP